MAKSEHNWLGFGATVFAAVLTAAGGIVAAMLSSNNTSPSASINFRSTIIGGSDNGTLLPSRVPLDQGGAGRVSPIPRPVPSADNATTAPTVPGTPKLPDPVLQTPSLRFGLRVPCDMIEPRKNVRLILQKFGGQALSKGQEARMASTVIVRPSEGGDDHIGSISANALVRVICTQGNFAVIKEERGAHDGVVESRLIEVVHEAD